VLSAEQQLVLQTIYDRFREDGKWPTFISIDRPLRREHRIDTRAVFKSLPDSLVVKSRQGMGPTDTDELTLRLPGIEAAKLAVKTPNGLSVCCTGSPNRR
jgi:hypothetical protein